MANKDKIYIGIIAVLAIICVLIFINKSNEVSVSDEMLKQHEFRIKELQQDIKQRQHSIDSLSSEIKKTVAVIDSLNIALSDLNVKEHEVKTFIRHLPLDSVAIESARYYQRHKDDKTE